MKDNIIKFYRKDIETNNNSKDLICTIYLCDDDKEEDLELLKETFNEGACYTDYANKYSVMPAYEIMRRNNHDEI